MNIDQLIELRKMIAKRCDERTKLGGFDSHAQTIIDLLTAQLAIFDVIIAEKRAEAPLSKSKGI